MSISEIRLYIWNQSARLVSRNATFCAEFFHTVQIIYANQVSFSPSLFSSMICPTSWDYVTLRPNIYSTFDVVSNSPDRSDSVLTEETYSILSSTGVCNSRTDVSRINHLFAQAKVGTQVSRDTPSSKRGTVTLISRNPP